MPSDRECARPFGEVRWAVALIYLCCGSGRVLGEAVEKVSTTELAPDIVGESRSRIFCRQKTQSFITPSIFLFPRENMTALKDYIIISSEDDS